MMDDNFYCTIKELIIDPDREACIDCELYPDCQTIKELNT